MNEPTITQTVLFADLADRSLIATFDQPGHASVRGPSYAHDYRMRTQHEIDHVQRQARMQMLTRQLAELSPIAPDSVSRAQQITTEVTELLAAERRYAGTHVISPQ